MIKSAFLSHNSASSAQSFQIMLKLHLLSNKNIIVPAASINRMGVDRIVDQNPLIAAKGAIVIAHGSDCKTLDDYIEKYDNLPWETITKETFRQFQDLKLTTTYGTQETYDNFNRFMRKCSSGDFTHFQALFNSKKFNKEIIESDLFNFEQYIALIDRQNFNTERKSILKSHASFFYNFFGSSATGAGSIVETDDLAHFNHIDADTQIGRRRDHLILLLISSLLENTDGISDFDFLSEMSCAEIAKLSFQEILEIREGWLHQEIIERYDAILQGCAAIINVGGDAQLEKMETLIEEASRYREEMKKMIHAELKSEIRLYKFFRILQFGATVPLQFASSLSGLNLIGTVGKNLRDAAVEIAVLANKEKQVQEMIQSRTRRVRSMFQAIATRYGKKSISAEYLRQIHDRLIQHKSSDLSNGNA